MTILTQLVRFWEKTYEIEAVHRNVNLVGLENCCKMSIHYLLAKIGVDIAENERFNFDDLSSPPGM